VYSCGEVVTSGCKKDAPESLPAATEQESGSSGCRPTASAAVYQSSAGVVRDCWPVNEAIIRVSGSSRTRFLPGCRNKRTHNEAVSSCLCTYILFAVPIDSYVRINANRRQIVLPASTLVVTRLISLTVADSPMRSLQRPAMNDV
jgi:hypothetical protein